MRIQEKIAFGISGVLISVLIVLGIVMPRLALRWANADIAFPLYARLLIGISGLWLRFWWLLAPLIMGIMMVLVNVIYALLHSGTPRTRIS